MKQTERTSEIAMEKFIYVFTKEDAEKMLTMHYELLHADMSANKYVFLNKDQLDFSEHNDIRFVLSDVLTFYS